MGIIKIGCYDMLGLTLEEERVDTELGYLWDRNIMPVLSLSWGVIGIGQFLSGFGCSPAVTLCYSFLNEECLGKKRQLYSIGIQLPLAIGECVIALLFLPDWSWRHVFFLMLGINVLVLISLFYLVESPKFLCTKSLQDTLQALNLISRKNDKEPLELQHLKFSVEKEDDSRSLIDLCRYGSLRIIVFGTSICFMAIQIIYYVTLLNLDNLGFSKLINQQILGVSEFVGYLAIGFIIVRVPRKPTSFAGLGISSLLCIILAILGVFKNVENEQAFKQIETWHTFA